MSNEIKFSQVMGYMHPDAQRPAFAHGYGLLSGWSFLLAFLGLLVVALLAAEGIVENEDVQFKWWPIKAWTEGDFPPISVNHHNLRWAINFPALVFTKLFGASPLTYVFINAIAYALTYTIFLVLCLEMLPFGAALVAFSLLYLSPTNYRLPSDLMPELFSLLYLVSALWFVWRSEKTGRQAYFWLAIVMLFFCYGAKETNAFFMPGLVLWEMLRGRWQRAISAAAIFFGLLVCETLIVNHLLSGQGIVGGRLQLIATGKHTGEMHTIFAHYGPWDIPRRWWFLGGYNLDHLEAIPKATYLLFFGASAIYLWRYFTPRSKSWVGPAWAGQEFLYELIAIGLSFAFCTTFFVISLKPLVLGQPLVDRYLYVLLPVANLVLVALVVEVLDRLESASHFSSLSRISTLTKSWISKPPYAPALWIGAVFALGLGSHVLLERAHVIFHHAGWPYAQSVFNINEYFKESVSEPLRKGCTFVFPSRVAAWMALVHGFEYGDFLDPVSVYDLRLDGLKMKDGSVVRAWPTATEDWDGLERLPDLANTKPYALRLENAAGHDDCKEAFYAGRLDLEPAQHPLRALKQESMR